MDIAALFLGFLAGIAAVLVFALVLGLRRTERPRGQYVQGRLWTAEFPPPPGEFDAPDECIAAKPSAQIIPLRTSPQPGPTDGDAA